MSLRGLVLHNFWLKFFSVALGTVIWMAVHYSIEHDFNFYEPNSRQVFNKETISVPVRTILQPGETRVFKITPAAVLMTVIGNAETLRGPEMKDVKIFVDLSDFHASNAVPQDLHPDVPQGVNVLDFKPGTVNVEAVGP